jgi:hypothetical protein
VSGWGVLVNQLCLFLTMCLPCPNNGHVNVAPPFVQYVYKFVQKAHSVFRAVDIVNLEVDFGDTSKIPVKEKGYIVIGYCELTKEGPKIAVNQSWWKSADDTQRELLIFHELGHCLLGRDHRDGTDYGMGGDLVSIMNWAIPSEEMYLRHYDYYIWELFYVDVHPSNEPGSVCKF